MRLLMVAWRETSAGVRTLCVALWCAGAVAAAAGAWGDASGWWGDKSFLTNLASSATSALFGVPFALVVIQHITSRQADERERREVRQRAARLARELTGDARQLVRVDIHSQPVATLRAALRHARATLEQAGGDADPEPLRQAYALWAQLVSSRTTTELLIERMSGNWRVLVEEVQPSLLRTGGQWPDRQLVELLDETLTGGLPVGSDLSWMDDLRQMAGEISAARLRQRGEVAAHRRRIDTADEHLRAAERVGRYSDEIYRYFAG